MIETYGNHASFHKVTKVEIKNGAIDGVLKVVIHQLVETDRDDGSTGSRVVNTDGQFVMCHIVDLFMLDKADSNNAVNVAVA